MRTALLYTHGVLYVEPVIRCAPSREQKKKGKRRIDSLFDQ